MKQVITALVKAKSQFGEIVKSRQNPFYKSAYADLGSINAAIQSALTANGLFIAQPIHSLEGKPYLSTQIWHESGECLSSEAYPLPSLDDPQKFGSAVTYARRYQLCALLNLSADDDDDGNAASAAPAARQNTSRVAKKLANLPDVALNPFATEAKRICSEAAAQGVPVKFIRELCQENGLPSSSSAFTSQEQVDKLMSLLNVDQVSDLDV